ncbi:MAG TPA: tetratricopeptide repeat protein [Phycisphaerales bacterium]|nr:tetratricopeptide repeat protein [Phycisphaerales bacterium]
MSQAGQLLQRANALLDAGQPAQAEAILKRAIAAAPAHPGGYALMTAALSVQQRYVQAEYFAKQALDRAPDEPMLLHNYGQMLNHVGKYAQAEAPLARALAMMPNSIGTRALLGYTYAALSKYASAVKALKPGVDAGDSECTNTYAHALHSMGRVEEAIPVLRALVQREPDNLGRAQHFACMLNYAPGIDPGELHRAHREYGRIMLHLLGQPQQHTPAQHLAGRDPKAPVRVGLLSPDLRDHAVGYLIEAFPEYADRSRVFVAAYSNASHEDARSDVLRPRFDLWRRTYGLDTRAAADLIRKDKIDVLIDLAGHTNGHRLDVLGVKPAPVQMTYMGFPNQTGLPTVDYRLVDSLSEPDGCDQYSVETLLRMDPCFLSYRAPDTLPPINELPMLREDATGPTFVAFSTLIKLNSPLFQMWARVLNALPGSTIILKHFGFTEPEVRDDVRTRFAAAGVNPARILAEPPEPSSRQILPLYNRADICLDTFPYNGTTTLCESCLMGVPIVSLSGSTPASRVSRSILSAVGTPELCASTEDEFVDIAVALAKDTERLKTLRSTLRDKFLACPIGDRRAFARRFTDAAVQGFEAWTRGQRITRVAQNEK